MVALAVALSAMVLSGCAASTKLAFAKDAATPPAAGAHIFLLTVTLRNSYRTSHQLQMTALNIEKGDAGSRTDPSNFVIDDSARSESDSAAVGNSYYLSLDLEQGDYVIGGITATSQAFPTNTLFFAPVLADLQVTAPGVYYLGHIDATVRERVNDEFKAGPTLPLLDQAVGGASGGTFDIAISDQWESDRSRFVAKFPALKAVAVVKAVLPPFDRARAQQWWEKH